MSEYIDHLPLVLASMEQLQAENATIRRSILYLLSNAHSEMPTIALNPSPPYHEP